MKISIKVYAHDTKVYAVNNKGAFIGRVEKREINEFDHMTYGIRVKTQRNLVWVDEDSVFTNIQDATKLLSEKFNI